MKIHKSHARNRETVCGLKYSYAKNIPVFINKQLAGHWRRVTCKNCLNKRSSYEKELRVYRW